MWIPTTNITPFEMVKHPRLTHLLTRVKSQVKFQNKTDFTSRTITIKLIIADIEIKVRLLFLSLSLSLSLSLPPSLSLSLPYLCKVFTQREPLLWQRSYKSEKYKGVEQLENLCFKIPNLREINCVLTRNRSVL